jgi:hypothetical protein
MHPNYRKQAAISDSDFNRDDFAKEGSANKISAYVYRPRSTPAPPMPNNISARQ